MDVSNFLTRIDVAQADPERLETELRAAFVPSSQYSQGAAKEHTYLLIEVAGGPVLLSIGECSQSAGLLILPEFKAQLRTLSQGEGVEVVLYAGKLPRFYKPAVLAGTYPGNDAAIIKRAFDLIGEG